MKRKLQIMCTETKPNKNTFLPPIELNALSIDDKNLTKQPNERTKKIIRVNVITKMCLIAAFDTIFGSLFVCCCCFDENFRGWSLFRLFDKR